MWELPTFQLPIPRFSGCGFVARIGTKSTVNYLGHMEMNTMIIFSNVAAISRGPTPEPEYRIEKRRKVCSPSGEIDGRPLLAILTRVSASMNPRLACRVPEHFHTLINPTKDGLPTTKIPQP